jgi:hypothetical protein
VTIIKEKRFSGKSLVTQESLMVVVLSLLFGFRPTTVVKMELSSLNVTDEGFNLTEAFRKGYTAKTVPKRRMFIPWAGFPELKYFFNTYFM